MKHSRLYGLLAVAAISGTLCANAHADGFCTSWSAYMWDFDQKAPVTSDATWNELNAMNQRLHKMRHIAAVGQVNRAEALAFPSIPSAVESELDAQTQARVRGYYERYIILGRRIEDMWKDKFKNTDSATSMQRFAANRDAIIAEMNKYSKMAKADLEHYGLKNRDCFEAFADYAKKQVQSLNQALASANATLKMDDNVWVKAYDNGPDAQISTEQVSARKPASAGEPAIVDDDY